MGLYSPTQPLHPSKGGTKVPLPFHIIKMPRSIIYFLPSAILILTLRETYISCIIYVSISSNFQKTVLDKKIGSVADLLLGHVSYSFPELP